MLLGWLTGGVVHELAVLKKPKGALHQRGASAVAGVVVEEVAVPELHLREGGVKAAGLGPGWQAAGAAPGGRAVGA